MTRGAAFSLTSILALGAMAACQAVLPTAPPAPVVVADKVTLDERAGIAVTTGYTAASRLGNVLSRAGLIDRKAFQALDNRGYAAVLAVRQAYLAGNAADYATAIRNAEAAITGIKDLAR